MKTHLSLPEQHNLGFELAYPKVVEDEFSYIVHTFKKNDCEMDITTEYDLENNIQHQYVDFNGETLKDFSKLTPYYKKKAIELLIKIM